MTPEKCTEMYPVADPIKVFFFFVLGFLKFSFNVLLHIEKITDSKWPSWATKNGEIIFSEEKKVFLGLVTGGWETLE